MKEEGGELDSFDTVITYLIDEEIASTFEEANALMTKLSAETISEIHESQLKYITEISAQLAHTASMKADEVARKARILVTKRLLPRKYNKHHASTKVLDLVEQRKEWRRRATDGKGQKGKGSGSKDACYHKVKSRYSVYFCYASGALVKCRKVGAANWGNKSESFEVQDVSLKALCRN